MKELEKGKDKIQKICDMLRQETLLPAQSEAKGVIEKAQIEAEQIVHQAHQEAQKLIAEAHAQLEKEKKAVKMALQLAARQAVGSLKQEIESKLFDEPLKKLIVRDSHQPQMIADWLQALVQAVKKEGMDAHLGAVVPKNCSIDALMPLLAQEVAETLKKGSISIGAFAGGVQLKLIDKNITIDMSDRALEELLAGHLRKEFRKYVFSE